jgi:hypothetical protein
MDGASPALPPIAPPASPVMSPGFARSAPVMSPGGGQQAVNPVGRPAADPEVQQQRIERSAERKRIESVAPKALDSRVVVYRAKDGKIAFGSKPVLQIVVKDLEDATADGTSTDDYVASKLLEKFPNGGKFIGRFHDKANRPMVDTAWDIEIGEEGSVDDQPAADLNGEGEPELDLGFQQAPSFQVPPPPPALDTTSLTSALRAERQDEARRGTEIASLIASQQSATMQMMQQLSQQQREAEERSRRDAAEREERAEKRRSEFRTLIVSALPALVPLIEKIFGKKDHGPSPTDQLLIEMFKAKMNEKPEKSFDATMMAEMAKLMQSMAQSNLAQQQEQVKASASIQSEVLGLTMKSALGTMKELMELKTSGGGDKEEGTLAQIAKIAGPLLAGMQQQGQQAPGPELQQSAPQQQPPQAQVVTEQPAAEQQPRPRRGKVPPPAAVPATAEQAQAQQAPRRSRNPADYPDAERIRISLDSIRRLSVGEIEPGQRFNLLKWVQQWAPPAMLEAVAANNRDKIMELGSPIVLVNPVLLQWVEQEKNVEFLMSALADLSAMISGTITRDRMDNAIIETAQFVKANQPAPGQRAAPPQARVIDETSEQQTQQPMAAHPAATTPPAGTTPPAAADKPTPRPKRPRTPKAQPPAAEAKPEGEKPADPPANGTAAQSGG